MFVLCRVVLQIPWAVASVGIIFNLPGAQGIICTASHSEASGCMQHGER